MLPTGSAWTMSITEWKRVTVYLVDLFGGRSRTRTYDPLIKSYQVMLSDTV